MNERRTRKGYLDWLRGLAVLVMIEAHVFDSWTRVPDRNMTEFAYAMIIGGFGAPLFLFLAGVAVPLSAGSKVRRTGDARAAGNAVARRGLEIFGLAFLFRVQSWILGWGPAWSLLKVDILNIMGPSIAAAALLWRSIASFRGRLALFAGATVATALATPLVRSSAAIKALPDPIEAYLSPIAGLTNFVFFPWAGFVFAGALVGLLLDWSRTSEQERRANIILACSGVALVVIAYQASFLPSIYSQSHFWTTSPAFFMLRVGMLTAAIPAAYLWESRAGGDEKWSPLRQLGRTSLFIYWIHVEMIYGLLTVGFHRSLSWLETWVGYVLFTILMLLCSIAKERIVELRPIQLSWRSSDRRPPRAEPESSTR
jgi:uncharacterized membrane protein